ncbi:hypothetical protein IFR04_004818 [Cadophora malorum]|uniref:Glyoxal oxidase N-terminal domain-containing protein n=1 Tax=Cadophora malorum TaxID=108018 RepID=A0A8H8BRK8_9HELO|nr:hypothetical protein IFR04_004818 [Cadophora malorum]
MPLLESSSLLVRVKTTLVRPTTNRAHNITLGAIGQPPQVEQLVGMIRPRGFDNFVMLPDGTSIVTGGMSGIQQAFSDDQAVYTAELFDPVTKTFRELAPMKNPRNYHSISLLLPDGRVLAAGGGMCPTAYGQSDAHCNRTPDHPDGEIFSPPYLFNADGSWFIPPR